MNGLKSALILLSIYPVRIRDYARFTYQSGVPYYGWAGLLVALPAFLIVMVAQWHISSSVLAFVAFSVSAIVTRMMHWDGLADVADAWWGAQSVIRRQEIMKDSSTGTLAIMSLFLAGLGTYLALERVIASKHFLILLAVPMLARIVVVFALRKIPVAKQTGLAAHIQYPLSSRGVAILFASLFFALILSAISTGLPGVVSASLTLVCGLILARVIARRMGGITGDVLGATIVLSELIGYGFFMALSIAHAFAPLLLA